MHAASRVTFTPRGIAPLRRPASLPAPIPAPLRARPLPRPRATSGDGGNNNNGNGGNGGNGGSGGGGGSGDDSNKDEGPISGWRARTRADPDFAFKVMVEQIIGVGAAVFGDMSSRPNFGLNELDFVFSTLIVGSLMNFALMYLLAPTVGINTAAMNPVMKFVTGETLRNLSAPTGHMFEPGVFTLAQRGTTVAYKAMQFGVIGFIAGLIGTAATNILISIRTATDPSFKAQNDLPEVIPNSLCWAAHMSISSNIRYQSLNGLDMIVSPLVPGNVFKIYSTLIRLANNISGGISFATIARLSGVQNSSKNAAKACPCPCSKTCKCKPCKCNPCKCAKTCKCKDCKCKKKTRK